MQALIVLLRPTEADERGFEVLCWYRQAGMGCRCSLPPPFANLCLRLPFAHTFDTVNHHAGVQ